jgi:dimethylamine monooxygenase subunit A
LQLRIELEHFIRLPMSGAVTFSIRTFMASLEEIKTIPVWRDQLAQILVSTPEDIATYKGISDYRAEAATWLLT